MTHKFKTIDIPQYINKYLGKMDDCKICEICNLVVSTTATADAWIDINDGYGHSDWFFLNEHEIYQDVIVLENLNLSCDEIIIKNIIE